MTNPLQRHTNWKLGATYQESCVALNEGKYCPRLAEQLAREMMGSYIIYLGTPTECGRVGCSVYSSEWFDSMIREDKRVEHLNNLEIKALYLATSRLFFDKWEVGYVLTAELMENEECQN